MQAHEVEIGKVVWWTRMGLDGTFYDVPVTVKSSPNQYETVMVEQRFRSGDVRLFEVKIRFLHLPFYVQDVTVGDKLMWQRRTRDDEQRVYYVEVTVLEPPEDGNVKVEWNHPEPNRDGSRPAGPTYHTVAQRYLFTETMAQMLRERALRAKERMLEGARTSSRVVVPAATQTVARPAPTPTLAPSDIQERLEALEEEVGSLRTDATITTRVLGAVAEGKSPDERDIKHLGKIALTTKL